jgi:hypothetical protein
MRGKPTNTPVIHSVYQLCMVAPTCFGISLPWSGSIRSAFWEMLNWREVDRILWMGVLCLVTWCVHVKYALFLSDCNENGIFLTYFRKIFKFYENSSSGSWIVLCRRTGGPKDGKKGQSDRQTGRHEVNIPFSLFCASTLSGTNLISFPV